MFWLAVDATRYHGGQTSTDDVPNRDLQSNVRFGLTASVPINAKQSVKINASTGVSTRTGTDFDTVSRGLAVRVGRALSRRPRLAVQRRSNLCTRPNVLNSATNTSPSAFVATPCAAIT